MTILGTPTISFGLTGTDWVIILSAVFVAVAAFLLYSRYRKRPKEDEGMEEVQDLEDTTL